MYSADIARLCMESEKLKEKTQSIKTCQYIQYKKYTYLHIKV